MFPLALSETFPAKSNLHQQRFGNRTSQDDNKLVLQNCISAEATHNRHHSSTLYPVMSSSDSGSSVLSNRREFIAKTSLSALSLFTTLPGTQLGAEESLHPLNRFPRMVQEYFVKRVNKLAVERQQRIQKITTQADAKRYVAEVRQKIRICFGPNPDRTPLNPRITRIVERGSYRIENVIFESRPGFFVTANLYVPNQAQKLRFPRPGIIGTCGHSSNGKAAVPYQSFAQGLAKQGYVVLIYDPIGQGERIQYPDTKFNSKVGVGVREHLYAGNQQCLVGEFIGMWRAWDGIRALDYLLSREEVDPQHIGVTGNSGGGTMTTWLAGLDDRYTMAAPSCFVTSFARNLENELPADTEQCPPRAIALGLDHEDFLAALAPKPIIILAKERDYFDVRGTEQAFARLKHLYRALGAEDKIKLFTGPTTHGYSKENREAMYGWFNQVTSSSDQNAEPPIQIEPDETLQCTPLGQVAERGSKSIFTFTRDKARQLKTERGAVAADKLIEAIARTLRLTIPPQPPKYRILRPRRNGSYPSRHFTSYLIQSEPGIQITTYLLQQEAHYSRPRKNSESATLYVSDFSADEELRSDNWLRNLIKNTPNPIYACDLRGSGESQPDTCGEDSFRAPYGSDYFYAVHSQMLDDPYPGQRSRDLLRVIRWLESLGHSQIHLVAKGRGTIPASIASLHRASVQTITLRGALDSYQSLAESEAYDWPLSALIPNVLQHYDLPDIYQVLRATRHLRIE